MADVYSSTVLQDARAFILKSGEQKFQLKRTLTQALDLFMRDREFTIPNLASIRQATTQTTTAMYLKKKAFTVNSAKSCSPSGEQSGSSSTDLSWVSKNVVIKTNYKQHYGNEVSRVAAFANDLYNAEVSLWDAIDQLAIDYLEANKSGVNAGSSGLFDTTNDIMLVKNSKKSRFYNYLTGDMKMNNYNPTYMDLSDTFWSAEIENFINQGGGNATNTNYQFGGYEFKNSNLIIPGSIGVNEFDSIHYVVPAGGVAVLDWNDPMNREGKQIGDKQWTTMQSMLRPEFTFDVMRTTACADTSSDGGGTQDAVETWELSLNYAFAKQPIATADETPIFKYGVMDNDTYTT